MSPVIIVRSAWLTMALVLLAGSARADAPPSWEAFDVTSFNGRYRAEVRATASPAEAPRGTWTYQVAVFDTQSADQQPQWSCAYAHDGYSNGVLSDDGTTFAQVHAWYEADGPAVSIYAQGTLSGVVFGREFGIAASAIKPTVSHAVWLDDAVSPAIRFVMAHGSRLWLEIHTIDQKTHLIDVASRQVVHP